MSEGVLLPEGAMDADSKRSSIRERCIALWDQIVVEQDPIKLHDLLAELNQLLTQATKDRESS